MKINVELENEIEKRVMNGLVKSYGVPNYELLVLALLTQAAVDELIKMMKGGKGDGKG